MGCALLRGTDVTCKNLQGRFELSAGKYEYRYCKKTGATIGACADRVCTDITDGKTDAIC